MAVPAIERVSLCVLSATNAPVHQNYVMQLTKSGMKLGTASPAEGEDEKGEDEKGEDERVLSYSRHGKERWIMAIELVPLCTMRLQSKPAIEVGTGPGRNTTDRRLHKRRGQRRPPVRPDGGKNYW
jgi:hypothetical protein